MFAQSLRRPLTVMLALGAMPLFAACEDDDDDVEVYRAVLQPLNTQVTGNITGAVEFTVSENLFTAELTATGLDDTLHPQHIHAATSCPTAAADTNNDGFIDVVEGVPAYGPILVPLDTDLSVQAEGSFPQGTTITYQQSASLGAMLTDLRAADPNPNDAVVKLEAGEDLDLEGRHVVVHGVVDNLPASVASLPGAPASTTLPVLCGEIVEVED